MRLPFLLTGMVGEINMMKVDTSFSTVYGSVMMCNQSDIIAKNGTRVTGTVFALFPPFDDAPVEQGFNWGQFALNVLGAWASMITAVVCTIIGSTASVVSIAVTTSIITTTGAVVFAGLDYITQSLKGVGPGTN